MQMKTGNVLTLRLIFLSEINANIKNYCVLRYSGRYVTEFGSWLRTRLDGMSHLQGCPETSFASFLPKYQHLGRVKSLTTPRQKTEIFPKVYYRVIYCKRVR
jgi:hypothetical protein